MTAPPEDSSAPEPRAGVVLAGGFSRRFGDSDKALVELDGTPLLCHVVERVGAVVDTVHVNCRAPQRDRFERALSTAAVDARVAFAVDPVPDEGPLAGLATALEGVETAYVAVVACDMPRVEPAVLSALFERAAGADGAVPRQPDGTLQPAQAVYRVAAMRTAARSALDVGDRRLVGALESLDLQIVEPGEFECRSWADSLQDVNTREDLQRLAGSER